MNCYIHVMFHRKPMLSFVIKLKVFMAFKIIFCPLSNSQPPFQYSQHVNNVSSLLKCVFYLFLVSCFTPPPPNEVECKSFNLAAFLILRSSSHLRFFTF